MEMVSWKCLPVGWFKLNTDGRLGCGGIVSGSDGKWLVGFSIFLGNCGAYIRELWRVMKIFYVLKG